jgi:hypothetical protein
VGTLERLLPEDRHDRFIETGYGWGLTMQNMINYPFETLASIELDPTIAKRAQTYWAAYSRVTIHEGDSRVILPRLLDENPSSTTLFLDAHYSGGVYYGERKPEVQCPLLEEIAIVMSRARAPSSVIIDDVRMLTDQWWEEDPEPSKATTDRSQWPSTDEVKEALLGHEIDDTSIADAWIVRL